MWYSSWMQRPQSRQYPVDHPHYISDGRYYPNPYVDDRAFKKDTSGRRICCIAAIVIIFVTLTIVAIVVPVVLTRSQDNDEKTSYSVEGEFRITDNITFPYRTELDDPTSSWFAQYQENICDELTSGNIISSDASADCEVLVFRSGSLIVRFRVTVRDPNVQESEVNAMQSQLATNIVRRITDSSGLITNVRWEDISFDGVTVNLCKAQPCLNGGSCNFNAVTNSASCLCTSNYKGPYCATEKSCNSDTCQNGGVCQEENNDSTAYTCTCPPGYSGFRCEQANACLTGNPCQNGGSCISSSSSGVFQRCVCTSRFKGPTCATEKVCISGNIPCQNGGTCNEDVNRDSRTYTCSCPSGYTGQNCTQRNQCILSNPCVHGTCEAATDGFVECRCEHLYKGPTCVTARSCRFGGNPCQNGGLCGERDDDSTDYTCVCQRGYSGHDCEIGDACVLDNQCRNGATCESNEDGSFDRCACTDYYKGPLCATVRACSTSPCLNGGFCYEDLTANSPSFTCTCMEGYFGSRCQIADQCFHNNCVNGECVHSSDGRILRCDCEAEYKGPTCATARVCGADGSPCNNGATCVENEDDTQTYICSNCPAGFLGDNCDLVDQCHENPCQNGGACNRGSDGLFLFCTCHSDYKGTYCATARVCSETEPCQNGAVCREDEEDTQTYSCTCQYGYEGTNCETDNYCVTSNPCVNGGECVRNSDGTVDFCDCGSTAYKGSTCAIARSCPSSPCQNGGMCNERDEAGYTCTCAVGYRGARCEEEIPALLSYEVEGEVNLNYVTWPSAQSDIEHADVFCSEIVLQRDYVHADATVTCTATFVDIGTPVAFHVNLTQPRPDLSGNELEEHRLDIRVKMGHEVMSLFSDQEGHIRLVPMDNITITGLIIYSVEARMTIGNREFTEELNDRNSDEFRTLEKDMCNMAIEHTINSVDMIRDCNIVSVEPGSVIAVVSVRTAEESTRDVQEAREEALQQVRDRVAQQSQNNPTYVFSNLEVDTVMCRAGTYPDPEVHGNILVCLECRRGTYKSSVANQPCQPCPEGVTTESVGATSLDQCNFPACQAGTKRVADECLPCGLDEYQNERWKEACKRCPQGTITLQEGSTSLVDCVIGVKYGITVSFVMHNHRWPYVTNLANSDSSDYNRYLEMINNEIEDISEPKEQVMIIDNVRFTRGESGGLEVTLTIDVARQLEEELNEEQRAQYISQQNFQLTVRFLSRIQDEEGNIQGVTEEDTSTPGVTVYEIVGVVVMDDPQSIDMCALLPQVQTSYVQCQVDGVYPIRSTSSMRFSVSVSQPSDGATSREWIVDSYRTAIANVAPNSEVYFMGEDCATSECAFGCSMEAGEPQCVCAPGNFVHEDGIHCHSMYVIIFPNHTASDVNAGNEYRLQCILLADSSINLDLVTLTWMRRNHTGQNEEIENSLRVFVVDYEHDSGWKKSVLYFWTVEHSDSTRYTCIADYQESRIEQYVDMTVSDCDEGFVRCRSPPNSRPNGASNAMSLISDLQCIPESSLCDGHADCPASTDEYHCEDTCTRENHLFLCSSGECISLAYRCDRNDDCGDGGSDELRCEDDCPDGFFACPITRICLPFSVRCDRNCDCFTEFDDGEICFDERFNASGSPCPCSSSYQIRCPHTGQCISSWDICDIYPACSDGWDERNCSYTCSSYQFRCAGGYCVQSYYECNGRNDCGDWSDELHCTCHPYEWKCPETGTCISKEFFCDGDNDCTNGEDEPPSCSQNCLEGQFSCGVNSVCVNATKVCNGFMDCPDGSDEMQPHCTCAIGEFRCQNGQCIDSDSFCNGIVQCMDSSDEPENCFLLSCPPGHINCATSSGVNCLPPERVCDGVVDCIDTAEDELTANCGCSGDRFDCAGVCVSGDSWCDGTRECLDGSDEYPVADCSECPPNVQRCTHSSLACYYPTQVCDGVIDCPPPETPSDTLGYDDERGCECDPDTEIQCAMGMCISRIHWCDGSRHCPDGSDERLGCRCLADAQLTCASGQCIPREKACDGVYDCFDISDESTAYCPCPGHYFRCADGSDCIFPEFVCDGYIHCDDLSDERDCPCRDYQVRCDSGLCISAQNWCDGYVNCDDGSDENRQNCGDPIDGCPEGRFACYYDLTLFHCYPGIDQQCDGYIDCLLGHDEMNCNSTCPSFNYQCHWGLCLYDDARCDGYNNCFDWTDEVNCKEACDPFEIRCNASRAANGQPGDFYCIPLQYACDHVTDCFEGEDEVFDENGECIVNTIARCGDGGTPIDVSDPDDPGVFASPWYPEPLYNDENCVWRLQASEGHVIRVITSDLFFYNSRYLTVIDSDESELFVLTSSNYQYYQNATFLSRGESLEFNLGFSGEGRFLVYYTQIHKDDAVRQPLPTPQEQGCGGEITAGVGYITSPNYPRHHENNLRCTWNIRPDIPGQGVQIYIHDFYTESCCDYLSISANNVNLATLVGYASPRAYSTPSGYMTLFFYSDGSVTSTGFNLTYSAYAGGTTLPPMPSTRPSSQIYTCDGHCGTYSEGRVCYCDDQCEDFGDCCPDMHDVCIVEDECVSSPCYNGGSCIDIQYGFYCLCIEGWEGVTCDQEATTTRTTPRYTTPVWTPYTTTPGLQGCGGEIIAGSGIITSPNYPNNYANNLRCTWTIVPETPAYGIQIHITDLYTESCCDFLRISADGYILDTLEGTESPRTFNSSGVMTLYFYSDSSITTRGFRLTYSEHASGTTRPSSMTATTTTNPQQTIEWTTNWLPIGSCAGNCGRSSGNCYCDSICHTSNDCCPDVVEHCGYQTADYYYETTANYDDITISYANYDDITISYDCGGDLVTTSGIISSPNFPSNYYNNMRCWWNIQAFGQYILLNITSFFLQNDYDFLTITANGSNVGYTGYMRPFTVISFDQMALEFTSDGSGTESGFNAIFNTSASLADRKKREVEQETPTPKIKVPQGSRQSDPDNKETLLSRTLKQIIDDRNNQTKKPKFQLDVNPHHAPNCDEGGRGFLCGSGECIYHYQRCDGIRDCADRSDESLCYCSTGQYTCFNSSECVFRSVVCDGVADCEDHSDEWECACDEDHWFYCESNGRCLPRHWLCDGEIDCPSLNSTDGSQDENDELCGTCAEHEFECHARRHCIENTRVCDGVANCPDSSDETSCVSFNGAPLSGINGLVARRHNPEEWYLICGDAMPEHIADAACRMMGFAGVSSYSTISVDIMGTTERGFHSGVVILRLPIEQRNILYESTYTTFVATECENFLTDVTCIAHTCGLPSLSPQGQQDHVMVINGDRANIRSWPWQVSLRYYSGHFCGGSIISEQWIVTAAHCVDSIPYYSVDILVGTADNYQSYNQYYIDRVILHPDYYYTSRYDVGLYVNINDIALIKLTRSLVFSETVRPICLADVHHRDSSFRQCYVTGWGQTLPEHGREAARYLQQGKVDILTEQECQNIINENWFNLFPYPLPYTPPVDERIHVCAGNSENTHVSACYGDSGGPLSCQDHTGRWFLTGVVSHGTVPHCSHLEKYTRISAYIDWINDTMANRTTFN